MNNLITVLFFLSTSYLTFGQFNSADLHSEITQVQPMTGIVFWSDNSSDLNTLGNKVQLEYSYLVYSAVVQNEGVYNWSIVDNLLADAAANGRQMIIRFRYTYPGITTPSVPNYIRNSFGYAHQILSVEGSSTYIPDWSSQELQDFTKEFFTEFAARYDNDPRLAFLQIGFGSYSEYHLWSGPLTLGQTFPSKSYQAEFLNHVNGLFQETQWGISIDAKESSRTPISSDNLQSLNYGLFDDSFLHENHSAYDSEYNRASWLFFGQNKYHTNAAGGELNYYSTYDQENVLEPNGPWGTSFEELSELYHISYMIGNDQLSYQPASRIESAGMAIGYRFSVEGYETNGSITKATIRNTGIAPIYYDAYPSIGGVRSNSSLKGLLPNQVQEFTISRGAVGEDLDIECDRLSPGQVIQFNANIDGGANCPSTGQPCDDQNDCTASTIYDVNCNCTGGTYTCGGNECITIDQNLSDWLTIAPLSSNAGFTLKAADDNNTLYISVTGTIGDFGDGYQIFLDTDNSGSEFTYYSAWSQTGFDAMIENGSFSTYMGTGSDWTWSAETAITSSKTTAGLELKIDKSMLSTSLPTIRIGFASLSNWDGAAFVPSGNSASAYTLSSSLNCGGSCPDSDGDDVCDADDVCPNMNDALIGTACNDGNVCTTGETYNVNCNCTGGTFQDADGDGICDANDVCSGGNDNIDSDGDGIPDACDDCNISQGTPCNDNDPCTIGEAYNAACNCFGGVYTDADGDGVCIGNDPNDNDSCNPNACNGDECITIDQNLSDWSTIAPVSSNAGFTLKAADDNNTLYISVSGTIGDFGDGYQIFLDTDNSGSEFTYYSAWPVTGFDAMIENGSFSTYMGTGSDWIWSAETAITSSKTTAGLELKIDKSMLSTSLPTIRIGFASLSNWDGAAFVPAANNAALYSLSSALNCDPPPNTCNSNARLANPANAAVQGAFAKFAQASFTNNFIRAEKAYIKYQREVHHILSSKEKKYGKVNADFMAIKDIALSLLYTTFTKFNKSTIISSDDIQVLDRFLISLSKATGSQSLKDEIENIRKYMHLMRDKEVKRALINFDEAGEEDAIDTFEMNQKIEEDFTAKIVNTFGRETYLNYQSNVSGVLQIDLFNSDGRKLNQSYEQTLEAGNYSYTIFKQNLSSGIYYVHIHFKTTNGKKVNSNLKMVVAK